MIKLQQIEPVQDLDELARMAHDIWFEYWPQFIGEDQTRYMVEMFQSRDAIAADIAENGYEYFFVVDENGKIVGYVGVAPERFAGREDDPKANIHGDAITPLYPDRLFISKIYLLEEERGKHYASQILKLLTDHARDLGLQGMYLTVNKGNELGIRAYKGNGFDIIESVEADIGNGFVMDDHIMACPV
ncbi:GNAT family N-acetyltransferase [Anaerotardibacter muris]|uniref:GNAT family N-acetyltransferase n=1 Tax=Anaerotardibacter muris TaxID=2941505 RepID=UPI00203A9D56|nr:GNAT family N-acetyltransferase [Anaerotardibacter muris]